MPQTKNVRKPFLYSLYFAIAFFLTWYWVNNPILNNYNIQLTAGLVVMYFAFRLIIIRNKPPGEKNLIFDTIILTTLLLVAISASGGLNSPLFFLIYFLLFVVALMFETVITLTISLFLSLFFASNLNSLSGAVQLLSLLFFTGLAIFFGNQYLKLLEAKEKIKNLNKRSRDLFTSSNKLSSNVASEETDALLWLSLNLKDNLLKIVHQTSELLSDIGHLTLGQKERLQSIHESAKDLLNSGEKLKEKIDRETE